MKSNFRWPFSKMRVSSVQALLMILAFPMLILHVGMGATTGAWRGLIEGIEEIKSAWNEARKNDKNDNENTQ